MPGIGNFATAPTLFGGALANANHVLDRLIEVLEGLARLPERGSHPKELVALGMKPYHETAFKPYRVSYRFVGSQVVIYLIADGRREIPSALARRLVGA